MKDESMELHEHKFGGGRFAIVLMDGRRMVAKARPVTGGYLIKGYAISLLDKKPHPMTPNKIGIPSPNMFVVKTARQARRAMQRLLRTGQ